MIKQLFTSINLINEFSRLLLLYTRYLVFIVCLRPVNRSILTHGFMYIELIKISIAHHVLSLTVSEEILKLSLALIQ